MRGTVRLTVSAAPIGGNGPRRTHRRRRRTAAAGAGAAAGPSMDTRRGDVQPRPAPGRARRRDGLTDRRTPVPASAPMPALADRPAPAPRTAAAPARSRARRASTAPARRGGVQSPLESYLREINATPLLTADEEKSLARRIARGDAGARDHMIRANLRLVVNISRSYTNRGLPLPDLIEEGNLGLMRAVEGFDPDVGTRFSTYASYWIKQSVKRALVNTAKTIRVPAYMVELLSKWRKMSARLSDQYGRTATPEEIAKALEIPKRKLEIVKKAIRLYQTAPPGADGEGWSLGEMLTDEENARPRGGADRGRQHRPRPRPAGRAGRAGGHDPPPAVRPDRRGAEDAEGDRRGARPDPRAGPPDRDRRPPPPQPQPRQLNPLPRAQRAEPRPSGSGLPVAPDYRDTLSGRGWSRARRGASLGGAAPTETLPDGRGSHGPSLRPSSPSRTGRLALTTRRTNNARPGRTGAGAVVHRRSPGVDQVE